MSPQPEAIVLDDILNEVVSTYGRPSKEALASTIRKYPAFARDITEFFSAWIEQIARPESTDELTADDEATIIQHTMSHVQNLVYNRDVRASMVDGQATLAAAALARVVASVPPITSLVAASKKAGISLNEFEEKCDLDRQILSKLERRLIEFTSIPQRLIERIAEVLRVPATIVSDFLSAPAAEFANGRAFLSKGRLRQSQIESFETAVKNSSLRDDQKARWLEEIGRH